MAAHVHCALGTALSREALPLSLGQGQGQAPSGNRGQQRKAPACKLAASQSTGKLSSEFSPCELPHGTWGNSGKLPLQKPASGLAAGAAVGVRGAVRALAVAEAVATPAADTYVLDVLQRIPESAPGVPSSFQRLRESSRAAASAMKWPERKDEAFRFTDIKPLQELALTFDPETSVGDLDWSALALGVPEGCTLVTVNGVWQPQLSSGFEGLPPNLIVGPISQLSDDVIQSAVAPALGRISGELDFFAQLNGAAAADVLVVVAREGASAAYPIHVIHVATSAGPGATSAAAAPVSSPRLLVVAQEGAEVELVEEFVGAAGVGGAGQSQGQEGAGGAYWANALAEITVAKGAKVTHGVVQQQDKGAFHTKTTAVQQEEGSEYSLIEAQLGGRLSRHFLQMKQLGPDTRTNVSTFCLCGARQVHDLHSSLVLDFPRGVTRQLHKCIVSESTGQGVFDGNVKVNKYAQQTDAGQLTRSLLLAPRGTVNVKPNLQIIADDVKCTHGAAISDLDDEQLFYFQARGIDATAARSALVFSFAAEVVEMFPYGKLRKRVEKSLKDSLLAQGAMDSTVASELLGADV